jgi:hypothetical protein
MNFTPRVNIGTMASGILTFVVVVLICWVSYAALTAAPTVARQDAFPVQKSFQTNNPAAIVPAVELGRTSGLQTARPEGYQLVASWYKSKHWWKRNAPIVGGAGGGALIGGLVGGGKGAIIGGAAGGGGGYLYKRYRRHHH